MAGVEYIGLLISLVSILYLFFLKRKKDEIFQSQPAGSEEAEESDEPLQEFLKAMEREKERRQAVKQTPPMPIKHVQSVDINAVKRRQADRRLEEKRLKNSMEERRTKSQIENRQVKSPVESRSLALRAPRIGEAERESALDRKHDEAKTPVIPSRARTLMNHLPKLVNMVIFQEIIGKPRGFKPYE